ncbi:cell envelope biogenesis protein TolA [Roseibium algae]|uniref:Cell envelope biogenesis protein TolA n=1 Tax=Roseibium algae TaxID=3123038 RepID=A0ABU8TFW5_9HYPH
MRAGLIASLVGHATVLIWGMIALPDSETFTTTPVDSLPVELVPISELTRLQKGEKTETKIRDVGALQSTEVTPQDAPQPEKKPGDVRPEQTKPPEPELQPAPQLEPEPQPEPVPEKAPEPTPPPEPVPAVEPEPAPAPAAEREPAPEAPPEVPKEDTPKPVLTNVTPQSKPTPPRPTRTAEKKKEQDFNPNQISALLNKVEPAGGSTSTSQEPASLGSRLGEESVAMSQSELDALRGQVAQCWSPPVGAVGAETLNVRVKFSLDRSGAVSASPEVLNSSSNPAFRAAASSAVRAVMRCGPYSLPAAKYETWQDVIINFDPREMLGG